MKYLRSLKISLRSPKRNLKKKPGGDICFFPLETKKTTCFAENFKLRRDLASMHPTSEPLDCNSFLLTLQGHRLAKNKKN